MRRPSCWIILLPPLLAACPGDKASESCADSTGDPSTAADLVPDLGVYTVTATVSTSSDCGPDTGSEASVPLDPALYAPTQVSVLEASKGWLKLHFNMNAAAFVPEVELVCHLLQDDTHSFSCPGDDIELLGCMSDQHYLEADFAASGAWSTNTHVSGTFSYALDWTSSSDESANPCIGECATTWTFTADWSAALPP